MIKLHSSFQSMKLVWAGSCLVVVVTNCASQGAVSLVACPFDCSRSRVFLKHPLGFYTFDSLTNRPTRMDVVRSETCVCTTVFGLEVTK